VSFGRRKLLELQGAVQSLNQTLDETVTDLEDLEASSTVLLSENSRFSLPPCLADAQLKCSRACTLIHPLSLVLTPQTYPHNWRSNN